MTQRQACLCMSAIWFSPHIDQYIGIGLAAAYLIFAYLWDDKT